MTAPFIYAEEDVRAADENLYRWVSTSLQPADLGMLACYSVAIGLSVDIEGHRAAAKRLREMAARLDDARLRELGMH